MTIGVALKDYETREAWLDSRTHAIGASEVAALFTDGDGFSLSPHSTAYQLWAEKTGQVEPEVPSYEGVELGQRFEPVIAEIYADRTGRKIWYPGPFCVATHPEIPCFRATPDRFVIQAPDRGGRGLCQIKAANVFKGPDWDEGTPLHIKIQVQAEMSVTGYDWDSVATVIGGARFVTRDEERDPDFVIELEERVRWFLDLLERGVEPPIDPSARTLDVIKRLNPMDNGESVHLPEEAVEWFATLERAKATAKTAEAEVTLAQSKIRAAIGANTFGELADGRRLSLKTTANEGHTNVVQPYTYRTLRLEKPPSTKKGRKR